MTAYCCGLHNVADNNTSVTNIRQKSIGARLCLHLIDSNDRGDRLDLVLPVNAEGLRQVAFAAPQRRRESPSQTLRKTDLLFNSRCWNAHLFITHRDSTCPKSYLPVGCSDTSCDELLFTRRTRALVKDKFARFSKAPKLQLNGSAGLYSSQSPEEETFPTQSEFASST